MSAGSLDATRAVRVAAEFPAAWERIYLNTAAEGLGSRTMERALVRYAAAKQRGSNGRDELAATSQAAKTHLARWLGCAAEDLAFFGSTSDAIGVVLRGLPWQPGDNVVITDLEFPSAMIGVLALARQHGIEIRVVPHREGIIESTAIEDQIDRKTRLVILSHVSFHSGLCFDLDPIVAAAHAAGALVLVDASQSLGAIPVHVGQIDFLVACTFKWLLASHGTALLYVRPDLEEPLPRHLPAWRGVTDFLDVMHRHDFTPRPGAERYESGMPGYPGIYALHDALQLLDEFGQHWIHARVRSLAGRIRAICAEHGLSLLMPASPERHAGIVSFAHPQADRIGAALAVRGVDSWYRDGRVRFSSHFYIDDEQIDMTETLLGRVLDELGTV